MARLGLIRGVKPKPTSHMRVASRRNRAVSWEDLEVAETSFHAAERKKLEQLTHPELLREVWRELAITVGMTCRAMQRQLPTLITKPKELAILIKQQLNF
jgi:hypothetical protein